MAQESFYVGLGDMFLFPNGTTDDLAFITTYFIVEGQDKWWGKRVFSKWFLGWGCGGQQGQSFSLKGPQAIKTGFTASSRMERMAL